MILPPSISPYCKCVFVVITLISQVIIVNRVKIHFTFDLLLFGASREWNPFLLMTVLAWQTLTQCPFLWDLVSCWKTIYNTKETYMLQQRHVTFPSLLLDWSGFPFARYDLPVGEWSRFLFSNGFHSNSDDLHFSTTWSRIGLSALSKFSAWYRQYLLPLVWGFWTRAPVTVQWASSVCRAFW